MPGYGKTNKPSVNGGSVKKTKVSKVSKAKKSNKSKKVKNLKNVKRGGSNCPTDYRKKMNGGAQCGSHNNMMKGGAAHENHHGMMKGGSQCGSHNNMMKGGFIRDGSPQNLMMRVSDKKKCKN